MPKTEENGDVARFLRAELAGVADMIDDGLRGIEHAIFEDAVRDFPCGNES
eukprot:gene96-6274_t